MTSKQRIKRYLMYSIILSLLGIEGFRIIVDSNTNNELFSMLRDTVPNLLAVFPLNFLFWYLSKNITDTVVLLIPVIITIGLLAYEFLQYLLPHQTFDTNDLIASLISMPVCIGLNYLVLKTKMT